MLIVHVTPFGSQPPSTDDVPAGPFDIGRSEPTDGVPRRVVRGDPSVSRNHVRLEELGGGRVRVTNTSTKMPVASGDGVIPVGASRVLAPPVTLRVGDTTAVVEQPHDGDVVRTMASLAPPPLLGPGRGRLTVTPSAELAAADVAGWFETLLAVQRAPAGSPAFYHQTARALVEQIGMDVGLVLLKKPTEWAVAARHAADAAASVHGREFSATVLARAAHEKRTIFQADDVPATESMVHVTGLVASPVLLPSGDVAGALYGVRRSHRGSRVTIRPLEAQMVQVLATAVGVGLARVAQEEESARLRVQLHQQFNDRLARELESDLGRLDPQDRVISILFADVRGFSRISERLGAAETFRFVSEVMEVMTASVKRHDGAVMDYVGDELIAMWNAPADHPDHARLAVGCAADLSADLADLSAAWEARLGGPVRIGVGVNSGPAHVGNTGTRSKPKYGALGHTVNVASRVQGATKAFGCGVLLTGGTHALRGGPARRLGRVKVVGIQESVELFQPSEETPAGVAEGYAAALARFEAGELARTVEALNALSNLPGAKDDGPTGQLAACVGALVRAGAGDYVPVIELKSK